MSGLPKWLSNSEAVNRLKESLEKSGTPLELKATKQMKDKGYRSLPLYYSDHLYGEVPPEDRVIRELDIYAYRELHNFKIYNTDVSFTVYFFIECKHREDFTLAFFKKENERLMNLPLAFTGKKILAVTFKNYTIPLVAKSHSEIQTSKLDIYKNSSELYKASNQAISACNYMYKRHKQRLFPFKLLADKYNRIFPNCTPETIREELSDEEIINDAQIFSFDLAFVIVNFDDNTDIIEAEFDYSTGKISNINHLEFCAYPILPARVDMLDELIRNSYEVPVFVTNIVSLESCIDSIESGVIKTAKEIEAVLRRHPHNLVTEILAEVFTDK